MAVEPAVSPVLRGWRSLDRRQRLALVAALSANALLFFDQTAVAVALRSVQRDFGGTTTSLQWIVSSYLLALAVFMIFAGRLADHVGRRRLFVVGLLVFAIGSLACAASPTLPLLFGARFVQGTGAAILQPLALAIVTSTVSAEQRGWAVGVLSAGGTSFLTLGPLIAGLLLAVTTWRWLFVITLPVIAVSLMATLRGVDADRVDDPMPMDWFGAVLLLAGLLGLVLGVTQLADWGPPAWAIIAFGVACLAAFGAEQRRSRHPIVRFEMFRHALLSTSLLSLFTIQFVVLGTTVFLAFYLNHGLGETALTTGVILAVGGIFTPLLSPTTGRLTDRWGPRRLIAPGLGIASIGLVVIGVAAGWTQNVLLLVPGLLIYSLSRPTVFTPASVGPLAILPDEDRALASSLVTESRQLGAVLGVAVLGAVFAAARGTGADVPSPDMADGLRAATFAAAGVCAAAAVVVRLFMPADNRDGRRRPRQ